MTPREWALFTGRYDTANVMHHLISRPCAEQICDSFSMEWPPLEVKGRHQAVLLCPPCPNPLSLTLYP